MLLYMYSTSYVQSNHDFALTNCRSTRVLRVKYGGTILTIIAQPTTAEDILFLRARLVLAVGGCEWYNVAVP
jgi:hypothetical protein